MDVGLIYTLPRLRPHQRGHRLLDLLELPPDCAMTACTDVFSRTAMPACIWQTHLTAERQFHDLPDSWSCRVIA